MGAAYSAGNASTLGGRMKQTINLRALSQAVAPEIPEYPELLPMALGTWRGRMINEYSSAIVFERLSAQINAAGLGSDLAAECATFADEERSHGVLCGAVVEALGGEAVFDARGAEEFPEHSDVSRVEALVRNLISVSCMSETVAVALIGAERLEMPDGPLRELLTKIYADEVGHARFGWRLVANLAPTLDKAATRRVDAYIAVALDALEKHELAHINPHANPPREGVKLGLCNGQDARRLFFQTVDQIIVPGLKQYGFNPRQFSSGQRAAA